jgi:tRNA threonylcarbamoyladenosine biosynthesis protein TsaB
LVPAIEYCVDQLGVSLDHVSAIAVDIGPGMFTGLRVGVTTAKVLAQTLRVPMIPIPSLDLLAYPLRHARSLIVPAIDARRNELYYALYRAVPGGVQRASEYEIGSPEDLIAELEARGDETLLCGNGVLRFAKLFGDVERVDLAGPAHAAPSLAALAELAIARYEREEFCGPDDVLPMYLRKSDAELSWDRKDETTWRPHES